MGLSTEEKLDQLAEFESQRDSLEAQKAALLAENKVPAEIQAIVNDGTRRMNAAIAMDTDFEKALDDELAALIIPDEIREALAKIDAQRDEIQQRRGAHRVELQKKEQEERHKIQMEIAAATEQVYKNIAARKAEIEAEFAGNLDAVNANIEALKAQIKAETVTRKKTVKGKFYQSIYTAGRVTWVTDSMESILAGVKALSESIPALADVADRFQKARKEGDPSTQLRRI